MTPILKWAGIAALVIACLWVGLDLRGSHESKVSAAAEAQSIVQQQAATTSAAQGAANVQVAQNQASVVALDDAQVAKDMARRKHPLPVPPAPTPGAPDPQPAVAADPVDDGTAQLIADQAKEIVDLKAQVNALNLAVTHYKGAYEDECKASALKEIALQAQISANKSSKWVGRIEGFAIGAAVGYAGGKL
jgi:hypothetical protein